MKKLLLIRHAKAADPAGVTDFERPLHPIGIQDAATMAARVNEQGLVPQILISSPALRTMSTANIFSEHLSMQRAEERKGIYNADRNELVAIINDLPDEYDFIGLVGHNPGMNELLFYYTGQILDIPTCAVALIEFNAAKWAIIGNHGKLVYYDFPKS